MIGTSENWVSYNTPNILSAEAEPKAFCISFANDLLVLRRVDEPVLFTHQVTCPVDVNFIGIGSGYNNIIQWEFCGYDRDE